MNLTSENFAIPPNVQNPTTAPAATPPVDREKIYNIEIRQLDRGYVVNIGCKIFAIANAMELITHLNAYILNPQSTEKLFLSDKLFK